MISIRRTPRSGFVLNLETIPLELRQLPNWVLWRSEARNGRQTKIPINAQNGRAASVIDPRCWVDFNTAVACKSGHDGLGFVFDGSGICGLDLDKCRDSETGAIESWAQEIADKFASYSEVSPSGTGIHIFVRAKLPAGGRRKGNIEMYDSGRFFCVTGQHVEGTPQKIERRVDEMAVVHAEHEQVL
jgi:putative DNA primase/helicase